MKEKEKEAPEQNAFEREDDKIAEEHYKEVSLVTKMMKLMKIEKIDELIKEYNEMAEKSEDNKEIGVLKAVVITCVEYELGEEKAKEEIKKLVK